MTWRTLLAAGAGAAFATAAQADAERLRDAVHAARAALGIEEIDELEDRAVLSDDGSLIGEVEEVEAIGDDLFAVVDVGGVLDLADHDIRVPLGHFRPTEEGNLLLPGVSERLITTFEVYDERVFDPSVVVPVD